MLAALAAWALILVDDQKVWIEEHETDAIEQAQADGYLDESVQSFEDLTHDGRKWVWVEIYG